jgi:hypothetical protein
VTGRTNESFEVHKHNVICFTIRPSRIILTSIIREGEKQGRETQLLRALIRGSLALPPEGRDATTD